MDGIREGRVRKTNLACDRCRKRKSRCDGMRPKCTHCRTGGADCEYRPTPTSLETDESVLLRLSKVEDRLRQLESRCTTSPDLPGRPWLSTSSTLKAPLCNPPELHTAAANKMLQCWPRIRLSLTGTDMDPAKYLAETTSKDWLYEASGHVVAMLTLADTITSINDLYDERSTLPILFTHLLDTYPGLSKSRVLEPLRQMHQYGDASVDLARLAIPQLIVLSMALKMAGRSRDEDGQPVSEHCLAVALSRQWTLHDDPDALAPLSLAMVACLVHIWARPVHALGILRSIDGAIRQLSLRHPPLLAQTYAKLSFILEGDILTEIDDVPSTISLGLLASFAERDPGRNGYTDILAGADDSEPPSRAYIDSHLWLRSMLNKILVELYGPDNAYGQPHDISHLVQNLSGQLQSWYLSVPPSQQFENTIRFPGTTESDIPDSLSELALRYFSCVFLLHRPVLYFFLHRDMEYTVRPPPQTPSPDDMEREVLASASECVRAAVQIVWIARRNIQRRQSWCNMQMVFAAYLVILQTRQVEGLNGLFPVVGGMDQVLAWVDTMVMGMDSATRAWALVRGVGGVD